MAKRTNIIRLVLSDGENDAIKAAAGFNEIPAAEWARVELVALSKRLARRHGLDKGESE